MTKYSTLFFDLDHTIWDFEANSKSTLLFIFQQFNLIELGVSEFQVFYEKYKAHNDRLWDRYRKGFINRDELKWKRMWLTLLDFKIANEPFSKELAAVFIEMLPQQKQLFPNTITVLDYCKAKGYDMSLITNGFEDTQLKKLANCGLTEYFTHVITSEKSRSVKPYPEIFEFALQQSNVSVDASIMIGDSFEVDVLGAQNIGMDQVFFNPDLLQYEGKPTYEIKDLIELKAIL